MPSAVPYWRLSNFYLFYFASLGAIVPYWSLYLQGLGFDAREIGELMAVIMFTKIVSPNIWGWIADHTGRGMFIVRLGSLAALLSFLGVFWSEGFWGLALTMFAFSFFWNASLPQFEANTLSHLGERTHRYSHIRLWGSIGFILAVAAFGLVVERWGVGTLPAVLFSLFAAIFIASLLVPEQRSPIQHHEHVPIMVVMRRPEVIALMLVGLLVQASHGPYYTFYTIYMGLHGYSGGDIGLLWALGVIAEVVLFLFMHRLIARFGLRGLLLGALWLTTLRWVLTGLFPHLLPLVLLSQLLHAASFGIFHAVAIAYFHRFFTGRHQGRGQAIYSSISFGAGGAVGSLYSGLAWDSLGAGASFLIAAALSALAAWIAWRWIEHDGDTSSKNPDES